MLHNCICVCMLLEIKQRTTSKQANKQTKRPPGSRRLVWLLLAELNYSISTQRGVILCFSFTTRDRKTLGLWWLMVTNKPWTITLRPKKQTEHVRGNLCSLQQYFALYMWGKVKKHSHIQTNTCLKWCSLETDISHVTFLHSFALTSIVMRFRKNFGC